MLPDTSATGKPFALVTVSAANLRAEPKYSAELVTQALAGTPLRILRRQNGWYRVQTPDRYISWVDEGGIHPVTSAGLEQWQQSERMIYTGSFTLIYDSRNMNSPLADITMGGIVELAGKQGQLLEVKLPDGRTGFTPSEDWISFNEFRQVNNIASSSVIRTASSLTGRPYLWGGTSAAAMDCSGFTKTVFFMHGLILARDASLQVMHGTAIDQGNDYENLQPGDLLFFGRNKQGEQGERITHVAISLGETEYIHASGYVMQNSFNPDSEIFSGYRKNTFIRARRIIGAEGTDGTVWVKDHPWY